MGTRDPRVDAYIARAAPFAQPILSQLRETVHQTCPDVSETIKWGMPFFEWHGSLCHIAAFKRHCALGFWRGSQILDAQADRSEEAMGQFGRITTLAELPPKRTLQLFLRRAMRLNEAGAPTPLQQRAKRAPRPVPKVPADFIAALSKKAQAHFKAFSAAQQREYIEWIVDAKRDDTRARRIAQAAEWLADGKTRNWKYER